MTPNVYADIVTKHATLTGLLTKIAEEDRKPTDAEKAELSQLRADIDTIKSAWESEGRKRFLESLERKNDTTGPIVLKADQSFADVLKGTYEPEYENLSLGKILKGYITGDWDGAKLEQKAMASSPTSAGGILIPPVLSARIIDLARVQSVLFRAGAATVPMSSASLVMARQTQDVSAAWYAEAGTIAESDAAFDSVTFTARKMAALVRVNNELLEDASNVDSVIQASIAAAMARKLDRVGITGTGTPPEPRGIRNTSGITTGSNVGSPANYDPFLTAIYAIRGQNLEPNAAIYSSRTAESLAKLKSGLSGDKTSLRPPADFEALSKLVTNSIPNNLGVGTNESYGIVGKFDELMIGLRYGIQIEVSRTAEDAFKKDQTMIRAKWRGDVQVARPKGFYLMPAILA